MDKVLEKIGAIGLVPTLIIEESEKAAPLARALIAGNIPCAEVTFRTPAAPEAIRRIRAEVPDILLGAGTVRTPDQVDQAADAGAVFVMTGGFNPKVVERCREKGLTIIPGCSGPGDIERALDGGIKVVKLFPIEQLGGLAYLQALSPLYPELRFVPSGGLNRSNLASYMAWDKTFAAGGSWMARPELIRAGRFDRVSALCKESVSLMLGFSLAHVGVNADSSEEALKVAKCFETMFGFATRELPVSVFAADLVEVMKPPYRGKHGHIGIGTYNVARARAYLERKGFAFDETSLKKDDQGNPRLIYLKEETGGFGIHLVRKNFS